MNDRGKPLSPVDMLKSYLLAPIEGPQDRQKANQTWKQQVLELISWGGEHEQERDASCIKAWLRAQYAESIRERKAGSVDKDWELIGTVFHRWVRDHDAQLGLGRHSMKRKDAPTAIRAFRTVLAANPADKAMAYTELGEAYLLAGQKAAAKKQTLAALEMAPQFERAQDLLLKLVEGTNP